MENSEHSSSDSDSFGSEFDADPAKKYKCTFVDCKKSFHRPNKLQLHLKYHNEEKSFKCDIPNCNKAYYRPEYLKRHHQINHLKQVESVKCSYESCSRIMLKSSLKRHILRVHNDLRKFNVTCSICQKGFRNDFELQNHINKEHETKFKCGSCSKVFNIGSRYRWHIKTYHKNTKPPKKPSKATKPKTPKNTQEFACSTEGCMKKYKYMRNLRAHINEAHSEKREVQVDLEELTCNVCSKMFKKIKYLRRHQQNIHSNVKPKTERKPRFDKNIPKVPMITQLTGIELTKEENRERIQFESDFICGNSDFCITE